MKTKSIMPAGHLQAGKRWILVKVEEKLSDNFFRFTVVNPVIVDHENDTAIFATPYEVDIHGDWFIEYDINTPILIQIPD